MIGSVPDLTPLELRREGTHLHFLLAAPREILPELPADYERLLRVGLEQILAEPGPLTAEVDLENRPALSSRQLGSLIALQKVLRPRFARVPLRGVSEGVRHLLNITRVSELFDLA